MLRLKSRPVIHHQENRDQLMPDHAISDAPKERMMTTSLFSVPGLFVGLCSKGSSPDRDSARSPTSPLEFRASFARSEGCHSPRSWESSRVGLGLVDSLTDETTPKACGKVLGFSESSNILFGSQMRINNTSYPDTPRDGAHKSLPRDYPISSHIHPRSPLGSGNTACLETTEFRTIRSCSVDITASSAPLSRLLYRNIDFNSNVFSSDDKDIRSESPLKSISSSHGLIGSLSASEIEQSEDYTCIICHGPNPKKTHIFGDCILESHAFESLDGKNKNEELGGESNWIVKCAEDLPLRLSDDFLSFCFSCKKKLGEGKDIYILRGEKAFCSCDCRDQEMIEEKMERPVADSPDHMFEEEILF